MTITVFSKPNCVQCDATKRTLNNLGLDYEVTDLTEDPASLEYVRSLGYLQAPVVVAGDDHWSGFRMDKIKALAA
jgi:glutaredoxin-like protein NrdH